jgi:sec-independent protein translocase protein TatC
MDRLITGSRLHSGEMSSAIGEDTKRAVAQGRATIGSMLVSARDDLRKAFLVFVVGFLGTFYALRIFIWDTLRADLNANPNIKIVAVTPFDVVLLQAKIGLVVGVIVTLPVLVYFGRDGLRKRGWWPSPDTPTWKFVLPGTASILLFLLGAAYAYNLFFPLMLGFLASNAVQAGFLPSWSIVKWAQFIFLLTLSFGFAAQLPLVMSGLSYLRIVSYETFRDKWRIAILGIFAFGAMFSPPDPFTQIMWALPLIGLYVLSLALARFAELLRRSSEELSLGEVARARWNLLAGVALLSYFGVYAFFRRDGIDAINGLLGRLPANYQPGDLPTLAAATGLDGQVAAGLVAAGATVIALFVALFVFASRELGDATVDPTRAAVGDPADIDVGALDAGGVTAAPPEVFEEMTEDDAVDHAREAMEADRAQKAEAILDRWDEVDQMADDEGDGAETAGAEDDAGVVTSTVAGVADSFSDEETTEDDIGGYYYDLAFIAESLMSKAFRILGVFMVVMGVSFVYLYRGGIGRIKNTFLSRMPEASVNAVGTRPSRPPTEGALSVIDQVEIVTLHPVEALIFEIKFSTILGLVATLPVLLYYAWPALKERGIVGRNSDRRTFLAWGGTLVVGLIGGSILGFFYVAPAIISWLATDAIGAHMVIHYRINKSGWLVIATTVGIGLLAEIPVTMLLFHRGGIVSFQQMFSRWREVVFSVFLATGLLTPATLLTMLVVAIPISLAYLLGLGLLWVYTLGGQRGKRGSGGEAVG